MKPPLASVVLRRNAPRETLGQTFQHRNRYDKLRDSSPAPSIRSRSDSVASQKRKAGAGDDLLLGDLNAAKVCRIDDYVDDEEIAKLDSKMSKVSTMCGKMLTSVQQLEIQDPLRVILADLIETVRITNEVQEELHTKLKAKRAPTQGNEYVTSIWNASDFPAHPPPAGGKKSGGNRQKLSGGLVSMSVDDRGRFDNTKQSSRVETDEERKHRKFQEAIKEAERSTLCFNLDMGNTPIMNKNTISERASLALAKMAAKVEGKGKVIPSQDKIESLDDVTSMVTNMELYGAKTQEYKGKDSTGFCTVPVKYQFKDRDQKTYAEKTLRDLCKVKCSTPYPAIVRECIKQVVVHVRASHPEDYVRVNVVPKEFSLKVSRRPPGKDCPWVEYPDLLRLPDQALDVSARKVPTGLRMFFLPEEPQEDMVTSPVSPVPTSGSPGKAHKEKK
jgi:hypothetical protein